MNRHLVTASLLALALAACGGGEKPPVTPADPDLQEKPPADAGKGSSSGAGLDGPAAPASSDDVKKGIAALKAGDLNGARASFEVAVQKNPKQADGHYYLGLVLDQAGDRAAAEKSFRQALSIQPDLEEAAVKLAAILVEGGKNDEAAELMKKAIAKNPKSGALQMNLAMALSGKGDIDGASKAFDQATKLEPNNAIYLVSFASHLGHAGKPDDAAAKLKQAEKLAASDPGVLASVALEYRAMKDFKSCVAVLDKAVALKDVAELRIYRGSCKLGLKDLPGATTEFKDAVVKEPNSAVAHYSLGNALADGKKLDDAIKEWETAIKLAPDSPQAKAAQAKIEKAKKLQGGKKK